MSGVVHVAMMATLQISLSEEEWSVLYAAADSIASSPEELARVSLVQRCLGMSEDNELCISTRRLLGKAPLFA